MAASARSAGDLGALVAPFGLVSALLAVAYYAVGQLQEAELLGVSPPPIRIVFIAVDLAALAILGQFGWAPVMRDLCRGGEVSRDRTPGESRFPLWVGSDPGDIRRTVIGGTTIWGPGLSRRPARDLRKRGG